MSPFLRRIAKRCLWLSVILIAGTATAAYAQSQRGPDDMQFLFAFGALTGSEGKHKAIPVQNEMVLHSGERLKLFIEPKNEIHVYLFHLSSEGELTFLFPGEGQSALIKPDSQVFIPEGTRWFQLDTLTGQEKFYFIVSAQPLDRLENLCNRHVTLKDKPAQQASTDSILNEIKQLRLKHKNLSAPAEKPVRIGGSLRGQKSKEPPVLPEVTSLASEISAPGGFYSRTFTIDHR
jgi:hypothetical protein